MSKQTGISTNILQGAQVLSFGSAVPEKVITNDDLTKFFDTTDEWIVQRTGIKERRVVDPEKGETAVSLGAKAAQKALDSANFKAEDIDLIICATATGDYLFPATACLIAGELGAEKAAAFDLSAACTGYVYALNTAYNYIRVGQYQNVLVVGVDLMSKYVDWSDRRTAILFGDGAGATLVSASPDEENGFKSFYLQARADKDMSLYVKNTCSKYPVIGADIKETPQMVEMNGKAVYEFAVKAVPQGIQAACEQAGIEPEEIDYLVPHQANVRIINSAAKRFGISQDKVIVNLDRFGNTSAASIPIAMDEALDKGLIKKSAERKLKICFVGFGAGLTWGASIIEY